MNRSDGRFRIFVVLCMLAAMALAVVTTGRAQETTADIEVYVKDAQGGAVPKASVEVSSASLLTPRTLESDDAGYAHFSQLPPGQYTLTVKSQNFRTYTQTNIPLQVGKRPTFDVKLEVGAVTETIEVTSTPVIVDVTSSKVATDIPQDLIDNLPKGRSFQSVISLAPGARQEPLQSSRVDRFRADGFQIDGASDSENTYLVEGLDTSNIQGGGVKQNVPFEFVQCPLSLSRKYR